MLRLGVIGDTQGNYRVDALLARVGRHFECVDEIWHAGDWQHSAVLTGLAKPGKPLVIVNGNAPDDHAYRWRDEIVGRTRFINVSSPTAAGFSRDRSMGVLTLETGTATLVRIELH